MSAMKMPPLCLQIGEEWSQGAFVLKDGDEDIHAANERRLKVSRRPRAFAESQTARCHWFQNNKDKQSVINIPYQFPRENGLG